MTDGTTGSGPLPTTDSVVITATGGENSCSSGGVGGGEIGSGFVSYSKSARLEETEVNETTVTSTPGADDSSTSARPKPHQLSESLAGLDDPSYGDFGGVSGVVGPLLRDRVLRDRVGAAAVSASSCTVPGTAGPQKVVKKIAVAEITSGEQWW